MTNTKNKSSGVEDIYKSVYGDESQDPEDWRKIDSLVRTLNKTVKKEWMEEVLLKYSGGKKGMVRRKR